MSDPIRDPHERRLYGFAPLTEDHTPDDKVENSVDESDDRATLERKIRALRLREKAFKSLAKIAVDIQPMDKLLTNPKNYIRQLDDAIKLADEIRSKFGDRLDI